MRQVPINHSERVLLLHTSPSAVEVIEPDEVISETPFEEGVHDMLDADLRHRMISDVAYRLYAQRGYVEGYDLDDWLQAEAQVDHTTVEPVSPELISDEQLVQLT